MNKTKFFAAAKEFDSTEFPSKEVARSYNYNTCMQFRLWAIEFNDTQSHSTQHKIKVDYFFDGLNVLLTPCSAIISSS